MFPAPWLSLVASALTLVGAWVADLDPAPLLDDSMPAVVASAADSKQDAEDSEDAEEYEIDDDLDDAVDLDDDDDDDFFGPCREWGNHDWVVACKVLELEVASPGSGPIQVDTGAYGGVRVEGWDRPGISVRARVRARAKSRADAEALADRVKLTARGSRIGSTGTSDGDGSRCYVEYRIRVPRKSNLALETENGPLSVEDVNGTMILKSQNGPIALKDLAGAVEARTENGPLSVRLGGSRWQGAGLDAATDNGPVSLVVPRGYSARLQSGTINGPHIDDHSIHLSQGGRHPVVKLGQGGPPVRVVTDNGPFSMKRSR